MKKRFKYTIHGQVQGVSYRASTLKTASNLGIVGFVQNLKDGSVYCEAEAESDSLVDFEKWLQKGPLFARVTKILKTEIPPEGGTQFIVAYS